MRLSELWEGSNLGAVGGRKRFGNFEVGDGNTERVLALVQKWVATYAYAQKHGRRARGIYLHGAPGSGKTHLACAAVAELILEHGLPAMFLKVGDVPRYDQDFVDDLVDSTNVPLLALDDLGAEKLTARMQEILFRVIDGRQWSGGVTLITSNLDLDALSARFDAADGAFPGCGQRVIGRIMESYSQVMLDASDKRREM
jgi:DNA replication protein DnaC